VNHFRGNGGFLVKECASSARHRRGRLVFSPAQIQNTEFMNIQKMLKQAQQMQEKMQQAQAGLAEKEVEVTAGGGKISVRANGAGDVLAIKISKDVVDPNDVEMLEDLILTGVQKAIEEGRSLMQAEMGKITGGMGLPPGLGF
jgi:hypothetical protein